MLMLATAAVALSSAFLVPTARVVPSSRRVAASSVIMATGNDAIDFPELDGTDVRVGIIRARWHDKVCSDLVDGVKTSLKECGVNEDNIFESEVPGSFELPLASRYLALSGQVDVVVPIGVLIKGETLHFDVIAESVTSGLMQIGMSTGVPIIFGVLTTNDEAQATDRSTGANNHGLQWGKAAVEMALLRQSAVGKRGRKYFLGFGDEDASSDKKDTSTGKIGF